MECFGFEPGVAQWKAQMNPLSYCGKKYFFFCRFSPDYADRVSGGVVANWIGILVNFSKFSN